MRSLVPLSQQCWPGRPSARAMLAVWVAVAVLVSTLGPGAAAGSQPERLDSPLRVSGVGSPEMGTPLVLDAAGYETLRQHRILRLTGFPLSAGEQVDLDLEQFEVLTPATVIVAGTAGGDMPLPQPDIALFRGRVSGMDDSSAILGISPRGCHGIIWLAGEGYVVAPVRRAARAADREDHVVHRMSELSPPPLAELSVFDVLAPQQDSPSAPRLPGEGATVALRSARVALEADFEYWSRFGNDYGAALDYIALLFAAVGDIYQRDVDVKLALTYIRIWTQANDPYTYVGGDPEALAEFHRHWSANHSTPGQPGFVERDVAHLLSGRGVNGFGWPGELCSYDRGYSISGGSASGDTPAESLAHDIALVAHELGHNFDGMHTHCFDPPIDKCYIEPGCHDKQDCATAPSTIMSYCHHCTGGFANFQHRFHARNIARMRSHIEASCLRLARNPSYVDWRNNSGYEDGTAARPYDTVQEGADAVQPGETVQIASGSYVERITIVGPMTLVATGGLVTIGE